MANSVNLQDTMLNQLRKNKIEATIFLTNGVRMTGLVKSFDTYTVLLMVKDRAGLKQNLIFKHAITTIIPKENVMNLFNNPEGEDSEE